MPKQTLPNTISELRDLLQGHFNCTSPAFEFDEAMSDSTTLTFVDNKPLPLETWLFIIHFSEEGVFEAVENFDNPADDWEYKYKTLEDLLIRLNTM